MTALLTLLALTGAGLALLELLRLRLRAPAVDLPVAWLLGQGWFGLGAMALRFVLHAPYGRLTALALALSPPAALLARRLLRRPAPVGVAGVAAPAEPAIRPAPADGAPRWLARPAWLFGPLLAFVGLVALAVVLHALASPTATDDGVRVRAFAPILAFKDAWPAASLHVLLMAGPVPTWVPTFAWAVTGALDNTHTSVMVLADLIALLSLTIGLGALRGRPERGVAGAFLVCSLPLFVYHLTTTYSDAPLAIHVAAGVLFALEYGRRRDPDDAWRALLLLCVAALVKREGLVVAGAAAALVVLAVAVDARRAGRPLPWRLLLATTPALAFVLVSAVALGVADAVPVVGLFAARATDATTQATLASPEAVAAAPGLFGAALFSLWNHGLLFWILPVALLARATTLWRRGLAWPTAIVGLLFLESAVSSIWLVPEYTLNGTTVHRSLIVVAVSGALLLAALLAEPDEPTQPAPAPAPARGQARPAHPPRRKRARAR